MCKYLYALSALFGRVGIYLDIIFSLIHKCVCHCSHTLHTCVGEEQLLISVDMATKIQKKQAIHNRSSTGSQCHFVHTAYIIQLYAYGLDM